MMDDARIIALFFARSEQAIQELDHQYGESCRRLSLNILNGIKLRSLHGRMVQKKRVKTMEDFRKPERLPLSLR